MPLRGSAAWTIPIVLVTAFICGSIFLTVIDPLLQGIITSALWDGTTTTTTNQLSWGKAVGTYLAFFVLLGFLSRAWIWTRRPG